MYNGHKLTKQVNPMNDMTRAEKLKLIYRHTHKDFKGTLTGDKSILVYRNGTCLVALDDLTDEEIEQSIGYAVRKEAERLEKIAKKKASKA